MPTVLDTTHPIRARERVSPVRNPGPAVTRWWRMPARLGALVLAACSFLLGGAAVAAPHHHHGSGASQGHGAVARIVVENHAEAPLQLRLDGRGMGMLVPGEQRVLTTSPGHHEVVTTYRQQGVERTLQVDRVKLHSGERERVWLRPASDSLVAVANPLGRPVQVRVDGAVRATLAPHGRELIAMPLGRVRLDLVLDGRTIDSEQRTIRAYSDQAWTPRPALVGTLVVENPLPIPVTLTCARGLQRTIPAYGRTTYADVPEGPYGLTVRRADGGETIGSIRPQVQAYSTARVRVPEPSLGILAVHNPRNRAVRVLVDGRSIGVVQAGAMQRFELRPGQHRVELVSANSGQLFDRRPVALDRYQPSWITVPQGGGQGWSAVEAGFSNSQSWLSLGWSSGDAPSSTCAMP